MDDDAARDENSTARRLRIHCEFLISGNCTEGTSLRYKMPRWLRQIQIRIKRWQLNNITTEPRLDSGIDL